MPSTFGNRIRLLEVEQKDYYSDIPADFFRDTSNNDVGVIRNLNSVQQSMTGIIATRKGERPFDPEFGCDIYQQLFELMDDLAAAAVERSIRDAIKNYEPRVTLTNVLVDPIYDRNEFLVTIAYTMITDLDSKYKIRLAIRDV